MTTEMLSELSAASTKIESKRASAQNSLAAAEQAEAELAEAAEAAIRVMIERARLLRDVAWIREGAEPITATAAGDAIAEFLAASVSDYNTGPRQRWFEAVRKFSAQQLLEKHAAPIIERIQKQADDAERELVQLCQKHEFDRAAIKRHAFSRRPELNNFLS
jgi:cell division septum initiation protein DivIVA